MYCSRGAAEDEKCLRFRPCSVENLYRLDFSKLCRFLLIYALPIFAARSLALPVWLQTGSLHKAQVMLCGFVLLRA